MSPGEGDARHTRWRWANLRKLEKRKAAGLMDARQRIDYLFDPGSFIIRSDCSPLYIKEARENSQCDGKVAGFGASKVVSSCRLL
ncbi:MAG: hypothetical protein R3E48_23340 [Burkholderiaceae bacterium]